jgi:hypothetical protein
MTDPIVTFTTPPADLGADSTGPCWLVRKKLSVELWVMNGPNPARVAVYPLDPSSKAPCSLVAGAQSVLRRYGGTLYVDSMPLTVLGARPWEAAAAVALPGGYLVRAFAAEDSAAGAGHGFVCWTGPNAFVADWWGVPAGFTAPRPMLAGGWAGFVMRVGGQIRVERAAVADVLAGAWHPATATSPRLRGGDFLGDPAGALEAGGTAHWAAAKWHRTRLPNPTGKDYSHQLGPVLVDGHEAVTGAVDPTPAGETTSRMWLPARCIGSAGLITGFQSAMPAGADPGSVSVGLVRSGHVAPGSVRTQPGFQAMLAASSAGIYLATSAQMFRGPA